MPDRSSKPETERKRSASDAVMYLTQRELARRWRMSERTLERWRSHGLGPRYTKIVGKVIYSVEDVEIHEAQHKRG